MIVSKADPIEALPHSITKNPPPIQQPNLGVEVMVIHSEGCTDIYAFLTTIERAFCINRCEGLRLS
jgi:hypothetical protein